MEAGVPTKHCSNCGTSHEKIFVPIDHECSCALFFIIDAQHRASVKAVDALEFGDTEEAREILRHAQDALL